MSTLAALAALGFFTACGAHAGDVEAAPKNAASPNVVDEELPPLPPPDAPESPPDPQASLPPPPTLPNGIPKASHYASIDRATCEGELTRRSIPFERVLEARGVIAPVRLKGPVGGVTFRSMLPEKDRRTSPYEIYDCRLVLSLDDFARILAKYGIVEVIHYSVYRPPPSRAVLHGPGKRHAGGLAIDAAIFKTRDGRTINVEKDFHGRIGQKTCGPGSVPLIHLTAEAQTLRHLVCEANEAQLFHVLLTPDYNFQHRNHFHMEVAAGVRWTMVR